MKRETRRAVAAHLRSDHVGQLWGAWWLLSALVAFAFAVLLVAGPLLAKDESGRKEKNGKAEEITFDDLKLELEKDEPFDPKKLTDRVKQLDKESIRIRGYILPASVFQQKNIANFVLVRDNMECCFGPGAALHDCIIVEMNTGKTTDFTTRPIAVEGVFRVREYKGPDGKHLAIYHLQGTDVK